MPETDSIYRFITANSWSRALGGLARTTLTDAMPDFVSRRFRNAQLFGGPKFISKNEIERRTSEQKNNIKQQKTLHKRAVKMYAVQFGFFFFFNYLSNHKRR